MVRDIIPWRRRKDGQGLTRVPHGDESPFLALHRQVDALFDDFFKDFEEVFSLPAVRGTGSSFGAALPRVELTETDTEVRVTAEMPGLDEKDVEVSLDDDVLTIRGEKKQEHEEKKRNVHLTERSYGQFQRVLQLPRGIDPEKVTASFKKGVLTITAAKTPEAASKRKVIDVTAE